MHCVVIIFGIACMLSFSVYAAHDVLNEVFADVLGGLGAPRQLQRPSKPISEE
jgi:hypothetical protein